VHLPYKAFKTLIHVHIEEHRNGYDTLHIAEKLIHAKVILTAVLVIHHYKLLDIHYHVEQ